MDFVGKDVGFCGCVFRIGLLYVLFMSMLSKCSHRINIVSYKMLGLMSLVLYRTDRLTLNCSLGILVAMAARLHVDAAISQVHPRYIDDKKQALMEKNIC